MKSAQLNVRVTGQFAKGLNMFARVLTSRAYGEVVSQAEVVRSGVVALIEADLQEAEAWLFQGGDGTALASSVEVAQARREAAALIEAWLLTSGGDETLAEARWPLVFRVRAGRGVMIA